MILQELYERAISIATSGLTEEQRALLTGEVVIEDLAATVFSDLSEELAGKPATRSILRRSNTITFSSGTGSIPQAVITAYLSESQLLDAAAPANRYVLYPDRQLFMSDYETRLGRYHIDESSILVVQPGSTYDPASGLTGDLVLTTPCTIAMPVSINATVVARDEVVEILIVRLASALRKGVMAPARS